MELLFAFCMVSSSGVWEVGWGYFGEVCGNAHFTNLLPPPPSSPLSFSSSPSPFLLPSERRCGGSPEDERRRGMVGRRAQWKEGSLPQFICQIGEFFGSLAVGNGALCTIMTFTVHTLSC